MDKIKYYSLNGGVAVSSQGVKVYTEHNQSLALLTIYNLHFKYYIN